MSRESLDPPTAGVAACETKLAGVLARFQITLVIETPASDVFVMSNGAATPLRPVGGR